MRANKECLTIWMLLILAGCGSYQAEPLTVNHPAHPDAQAGIVESRSKTLAYTAADLPPASIKSTAADPGHDAHHAPSGKSQKTAIGEGSIVAVVPATGQLVIQHGEIKDFMGPMTMGYPTEPSTLLEGLKPGDKVRFSIDTEKKVITKIEKLG